MKKTIFLALALTTGLMFGSGCGWGDGWWPAAAAAGAGVLLLLGLRNQGTT